MNRKVDTVSIKTKSGPAEYAKVATRLAEFIADNMQCSIKTTLTFHTGQNTWLICKAVVSNSRGEYSGHSVVRMTGEAKAAEKAETIAVGRALAFAGYLSSGEIASFEEMSEHAKEVSDFQSKPFYIHYKTEIETATDSDKLREVSDRVRENVADKTIDVPAGADLLRLICDRYVELD